MEVEICEPKKLPLPSRRRSTVESLRSAASPLPLSPPSLPSSMPSVGVRLISPPTRDSGVPPALRTTGVDGALELHRPKTSNVKSLLFDFAAPPGASSAEVYEGLVEPELKRAMAADLSLCILAHGSYSSGKTSTIRGRLSDEPGVAARLAHQLGDLCAQSPDECTLLVSAVLSSIHTNSRERIIDALALPDSQSNTGLAVREHSDGMPHASPCYVANLTQLEAKGGDEAVKIVESAMQTCRREESLSDAIRVHFLLSMEVRKVSKDGAEKLFSISVLDLGGIARARAATKGAAGRASSSTIGRGSSGRGPAAAGRAASSSATQEDPVLRALGRVVDALETSASFVPYRDSKLTRLISPALGGGASLLALIHVRDDKYEESEAALTFGKRLHKLRLPEVPAKVWFPHHEARAAEERIAVACTTLGLPRDGLTSGAIHLDETSSDELLQLQSDLLLAERLAARLNLGTNVVPALHPIRTATNASITGTASNSGASAVPKSALSLLKGRAPARSGSRAAEVASRAPTALGDQPAQGFAQQTDQTLGNREHRVGETVLAQFDNGEWYDAKILRAAPGGTYTVHFIDDGIELKLGHDRIRPH